MKHLAVCLASLLLVMMSAFGAPKEEGKMNFQGRFLFEPVPNEELYSDMLIHMNDFITQTADPSLKKELKAFVASVKKSHGSDAYAWIAETFEFVDKLKKEYPPCVADIYEPSESAVIRKNILLLLDFPMHCDEQSDEADPQVVAVYPHARNVHNLITHEDLMTWLNLPAPAENEIRVAKVYSSGFLFRTAQHILALDVRWQGSEDDAVEICNKADLFVLTHNHNDHYSLNILERMMLMGKPVVGPSNNFFESKVANVLASYNGDNKHIWSGPMGTHFPRTQIGPARIEAVMASQVDVPCLLYMIEMDGWRIASVGDNSHHKYQECYEKWEVPDFICTPNFQGFRDIMARVSKAPNPDGRKTYFLPHHENEMHHNVRHRVGYRYLFYGKDTFGGKPFGHFTPYVLLDNGESITFTK